MKEILKKISFIICICLTIASCNENADNNIQTVEGKIKGLGNSQVVLTVGNMGQGIDTVQAINGHFVFEHKLNINDPRFYSISFPDLGFIMAINGGNGFFIDSKKIEITGAIKDTTYLNLNSIFFIRRSITGSSLTDEFINIGNRVTSMELRNAYENKKQIEKKVYGQKNGYESIGELQKAQTLIDSLSILRIKSLIKSVPNGDKSIAMAYRIHSECVSASLRVLKGFINEFSEEISNTYYIKDFKERIQTKGKTAVGAKIPELMLTDLDNKEVNLAQLVGKGNFVLLDFWAYW